MVFLSNLLVPEGALVAFPIPSTILRLGDYYFRKEILPELLQPPVHFSMDVRNHIRCNSSGVMHLLTTSITAFIQGRGVATAVLAVSMIRDSQATGAPTCVTTGLSFLKKGPDGVLIRGPLRTSYATVSE
ncbi:hypothetical protein TNCV_896891 [Trichonephila clavipes]|nr:hypothetical protein TNCV_896891 [Trichonephila clavipes]